MFPVVLQVYCSLALPFMPLLQEHMVQCGSANPQPLLLRIFPKRQSGTRWFHAAADCVPCVPANAAAGFHGEQHLLQLRALADATTWL